MKLNLTIKALQFGFDDNIVKEIDKLSGGDPKATDDMKILMKQLNSQTETMSIHETSRTTKTSYKYRSKEKMRTTSHHRGRSSSKKTSEEKMSLNGGKLMKRITKLEEEKKVWEEESVPLKTFEKSMRDRDREKMEFRKKIADLELKLRVLQEKIKRDQKSSLAAKELEKVKKINEEMRKVLKAKIGELENKTILVENNQNLIEELEKTISELLDNKEKLLEKNQVGNDKIVKLEVENAMLRQRLNDAENKAMALPEKTGNPEIDDLIDQLKKANEELRKEKDEKHTFESKLKQSEKKRENLEEEVKKLQKLLDEKDGTIMKIRETITIREREVITMRQKMKKIEGQAGKSGDMEEEILLLKEEKEEREKKMTTVEEQLEEVKTRNKDLEEELAKEKKEREILEKENKDLKEELEKLKKENEDLKEELKKLKKENKDLKEENDDKDNKKGNENEDLKKENEDLKKENEDLRDEFEKLKAKNAELEKERDHAIEELHLKENDIIRIQETITIREKEFIKIREKKKQEEIEQEEVMVETIGPNHDDDEEDMEEVKQAVGGGYNPHNGTEMMENQLQMTPKNKTIIREFENIKREFIRIRELRIKREKINRELMEKLRGQLGQDRLLLKEKGGKGVDEVREAKSFLEEDAKAVEEDIRKRKEEEAKEKKDNEDEGPKITKVEEEEREAWERDNNLALRRCVNELEQYNDIFSKLEASKGGEGEEGGEGGEGDLREMVKKVHKEQLGKSNFSEKLEKGETDKIDDEIDEGIQELKRRVPEEYKAIVATVMEKYVPESDFNSRDKKKEYDEMMDEIMEALGKLGTGKGKGDVPQEFKDIVEKLHKDKLGREDFEEQVNEDKVLQIGEDLQKGTAPMEFKKMIQELHENHTAFDDFKVKDEKREFEQIWEDLKSALSPKSFRDMTKKLHEKGTGKDDFEEKEAEKKFDKIEEDLEELLNKIPEEYKVITKDMHEKVGEKDDFDIKDKTADFKQIKTDIDEGLERLGSAKHREFVKSIYSELTSKKDFDKREKEDKEGIYEEIGENLKKYFECTEFTKEMFDSLEGNGAFKKKYDDNQIDEVKKVVEERLTFIEYKNIVKKLHKEYVDDENMEKTFDDEKFNEIEKDLAEAVGPKVYMDMVKKVHGDDLGLDDFDQKHNEKKFEEIQKDIEDGLGSNVYVNMVKKLHSDGLGLKDFEEKNDAKKFDEIEKDLAEGLGPKQFRDMTARVFNENGEDPQFRELEDEKKFDEIEEELKKKMGGKPGGKPGYKDIVKKLHNDKCPTGDFDKQDELNDFNQIMADIEKGFEDEKDKDLEDFNKKLDEQLKNNQQILGKLKGSPTEMKKVLPSDDEKRNRELAEEMLQQMGQANNEIKDEVDKLPPKKYTATPAEREKLANALKDLMKEERDTFGVGSKTKPKDWEFEPNIINEKKFLEEMGEGIDAVKEDNLKTRELFTKYDDLTFKSISDIYHALNNIDSYIINIGKKYDQNKMLKELFGKNVSQNHSFVENLNICREFAAFLTEKMATFKPKSTNWLNDTSEEIIFCKKIEKKLDNYLESNDNSKIDVSALDTSMLEYGLQDQLKNNNIRLQKIYDFIDQIIYYEGEEDKELKALKKELKELSDKAKLKDVAMADQLKKRLDNMRLLNDGMTDTLGVAEGFPREEKFKVDVETNSPKVCLDAMDAYLDKMGDTNQDIESALRNKDLNLDNEDDIEKEKASAPGPGPENIEAIRRQTRLLLGDDIARLKEMMTPEEIEKLEKEVSVIDESPELTPAEKTLKYLDKINDIQKRERFILKDRVERVKVVDHGKEHQEKLRSIMNQLERFTEEELVTLREAQGDYKAEEFVLEVEEETTENYVKNIDLYMKKMDKVNLEIRDALDKTGEPEEKPKNTALPKRSANSDAMENFQRLKDLVNDQDQTLQMADSDREPNTFNLTPNSEDANEVQKATEKALDRLEEGGDDLRSELKKMKNGLEGKGEKNIDPEAVKEIMERCKRLISMEKETLDILREDEVYEQFELDVEGEEQKVYIEGTHACLDKLEEYNEEFKELSKQAKDKESAAQEMKRKLRDLKEALKAQVDKAGNLVELASDEKPEAEEGEGKEEEEVLKPEDPQYEKKLVRKLARKHNDLEKILRKKNRDQDSKEKNSGQKSELVTDLYQKSRVTLEKQVKIYEFLSRTDVTDKVLSEEMVDFSVEEYLLACTRITERVDHYSKKIDRQIKTNEDLIYEDLSTIFHSLNSISSFMSSLTFKRTENEIFSQQFDKTIKREHGTVESLEINKQFCLFIKSKFEAFKKMMKIWVTSFEKQIEYTKEIEDVIDDMVLSKSQAFDLSKFKSFETGDTFETKLRNNQLRLQKINAFIKKVESEGFGGGAEDEDYFRKLYYKMNKFAKIFQEFMVETTDDDMDHVRDYPEDVTDTNITLVKDYLYELADVEQEMIDENGDYVITRIDKILEAKNRVENEYQTLRVLMDDQEEELNRKTQEVSRLLIKCSMLVGRCKQMDIYK